MPSRRLWERHGGILGVCNGSHRFLFFSFSFFSPLFFFFFFFFLFLSFSFSFFFFPFLFLSFSFFLVGDRTPMRKLRSLNCKPKDRIPSLLDGIQKKSPIDGQQ